MKDFLPFLSTLIWQAIIVLTLFQLRAEIKSLLGRIARFKFQDTEIEFQETSEAVLDTPPIAKELLTLRDETGFFTREGVFDLVNTSKYVEVGEKAIDGLIVFNTQKQHTWLVRTGTQLFYILDDESTRAKQSLIQKRMPLSDISPIRTQKESSLSGTFNIGGIGWWYYSLSELGSPSKAKLKLDEFLK